MSQDDRARYWVVLNRVRRIAVETHATSTRLNPTIASQRDFATGLVVGSAIWLLGTGVLAKLGIDVIALLALAIVGVVVMALGAHMLVDWRRWVRARGPYEERSAWRETVRAKVRAMLGDDIAIDTEGVSDAARFLEAHWPDRAPERVMWRMAVEEHRMTFVGVHRERPTLIQLIDAVRPAAHLHPPTLAILVAATLDPARSDASAEATRALLVARGLTAGATRAGVWAIHDGPAVALVDADLEGVLAEMGTMCATLADSAAPPVLVGEEAADDAELDGTARAEKAIDAFLRGLRDGDDLEALAHTDPLIFSGPMEPTAHDLGAVVDAAKVRPRSWSRAGDVQAIDDDARLVPYDVVLDGRAETHIQIYATRRLDRWLVRGISTNEALLVGFDFDQLRP